MKPFIRDVLVNLLANLLAAGIIYLLGAALGLFPSSRLAVFGASGLLITFLSGGCFAWVMSRDQENDKHPLFWLGLGFALLFAAMGGLILAEVGEGKSNLGGVVAITGLFGAIGTGSLVARAMARAKAGRQATQPNAAGEPRDATDQLGPAADPMTASASDGT